MTDTSLNPGGLREEERADGSSHWVRRTALVTFCLLLAITLVAVFMRVIAARVPEQRATLEKLITERTGLAVRFDNVHFAWGLDGTSAVFTRVELTDPKAGRVRLVAPELRVEFDAWDFLRHHQFSLGHVTVTSPDIEIYDEPGAVASAAPRVRPAPAAPLTEAAFMRRYLAWADLMPNGRIEVEGARVHLLRRGERGAHHSFTLSQAVMSRSARRFNAYGTMLLSQDVGQSLFVSVKLGELDARAQPAGELRLIARRILLDRLGIAGLEGRGTLDAKVGLRAGRVVDASLTANARELALGAEHGARFDHAVVTGALARDGADVLLEFTDLQLTRESRLERAPRIAARVRFEPGSVRIARTTVDADRIPFMAAELIAGILAPRMDARAPELPAGWTASAGELRAVHFDSGARHPDPRAWTLAAEVAGATLDRGADGAQISGIAARVAAGDGELRFEFDGARPASLRTGAAAPMRAFTLQGGVRVAAQGGRLAFDALQLRSDASELNVAGEWRGTRGQAPLEIAMTHVDHALVRELWRIHAADAPVPEPLTQLDAGHIDAGAVSLAAGEAGIDWSRSSGSLTLSGLDAPAADSPRLTAAAGVLSFSRGATRLVLAQGRLDDLAITGAQLDWPRRGEPRLAASLAGSLASTVLRGALVPQGLDRLAGDVALDVSAAGAQSVRNPDAWRVTAHVSGASVPLGGALPPVEKLSGTVRIADRQLRALNLAGSWLGGPVQFEARRGSARGPLLISASGVADSAPLLGLLAPTEAAAQVDGMVAWTGSAQRLAARDEWTLTLASTLAGLESRLPQPFDKPRARAQPLTAQVRVDAQGVREFSIDGGRAFQAGGEVTGDVLESHFAVQGIEGRLRRTPRDDMHVALERLDVRRAPALLAAAGGLLPRDSRVALQIGTLRYSGQDLGALRATLGRDADGVEFSLESAPESVHRIAANGACRSAEQRCKAEFSAQTAQLAALLRDAQLPPEWPTAELTAAGQIGWPLAAEPDARSLSGAFDLTARGNSDGHQLAAHATLADGEILLADVQGSGPAESEVFRGSGRVSLLAQSYDLAVDYEPVSLAATAVPTPARARVARALNVLRGSAARRGWTSAPEPRRVQWHGTWEDAR